MDSTTALPSSASSPSDADPTALSALVRTAAALADPTVRPAAARALGAALGGTTVIVFVRDPEVGVLLPAPGFAQTLPSGRAWREYLEACVSAGERAASVPPERGAAPAPAFGFSAGMDAVAVIVGTDRPASGYVWLRELLPLIAAALRNERTAAYAGARARAAERAAAHAEALTHALDAARGQLQHALAEVAEARGAAETANRAKSDFLASMSHELRTPLNAIAGHVQLIELGIHGPVTDAQREALARIERGQKHLLGLINDILNFARIEAGRIEYRIRNVALADAIADIAPMIEPQMAAKELRYTVLLDGERTTVRADREKLQQVLLNLLSNATKFTDPGGRVSVETMHDGDAAGTVSIHVTDTGCGIPREKLESIFDPFIQVDPAYSRSGSGTGLGLAISRDLARGMGGDLHARSTPGEGSTFTLTVPRGAR